MVVREGEESRRRLGFRAAEMESLVRQRGGEGWTDFRDVPEWQKQPLSRLFFAAVSVLSCRESRNSHLDPSEFNYLIHKN